MLLSFFLAALPVAAWSFLRQRRSELVSPDALRTCDALLRLVAQLQQHRGLSSGWLSGDRGFETRMMARRVDIEATLAELMPLVAKESANARPCLTSNDLSLFRHQWRMQAGSLASGSVEQNIARHTQLIARALDWLAAVGEARIELIAGRRLPPGLVRNYTNCLPALSECLGQSRAIGSSVAVKKGCSAVSRVRLMFLVSRAEFLLDQSCAGVELDQVGQYARAAVQRLASTVRGEMLAAANVSVSADAYFTTATQAIDAVLDWAHHSAAQIESSLALTLVVPGRVSHVTP
jgi:hypothetical protein